MRVEDYNMLIESKRNIVNRAINIFSSTASTAEDVATAIKSVELIYQPSILDEFTDFFSKLYEKISALSADSPSATELMFLARGLQQIENKDTDFDNLDIQGNVVVGNRTLEHFDDKVLEQFYDKET